MQTALFDIEKALPPRLPVYPATASFTTPLDFVAAIHDIYPNSCASQAATNQWFRRKDQPEISQWFDWDVMIASATSYFGAPPRKKKLVPWQKIAYDFTRRFPNHALSIHVMRPYHQYNHTQTSTNNTMLIWRIEWRGDYTDFCLPHQDYGGENTWATKDGVWLYHTNAD